MNTTGSPFKQSMGPDNYGWNNLNSGSDGTVICEFCGSVWPERDGQSYTLLRFLGKQVVAECCGQALDVIYRESGEEFVRVWLEEFAQNPISPKFAIFLRGYLPDALKKARQSSLATAEQISEVQKLLPA